MRTKTVLPGSFLLRGSFPLLLLLVIPLWLSPAHGQNLVDPRTYEPRLAKPWEMSYSASVAALVAANALDIHSSYGKHELNPLVAGGDGRFTGRSVAIKSGLVAGSLFVQWLVIRKHPEWKGKFAWLNIGTAGLYSTAAIRNYGVPTP